MSHPNPSQRSTGSTPRGRRVREVFQVLRRDVSSEEMSDLDILRAAERFVRLCERPRRRKVKRREPWATSGAERRMAVDHALRSGFRIFSDMDGLFDDAFVVDERTLDSAYDVDLTAWAD